MWLTGCRVHTPVIKNTQCSYSTTNRLPTQLLSQVRPSHPLIIPALTARHCELGIPIPTTTTFTSSLPAHLWQLCSGAHPTTEHQLPCWSMSETETGKVTIHISTAVMQPKRGWHWSPSCPRPSNVPRGKLARRGLVMADLHPYSEVQLQPT